MKRDRTEYGKAYRAENREKETEKVRRWRAANPEKHAECGRRYREKNREKERARKREHRYGITAEQYIALLAEQNGMCAIGKETCTGELHVDHCHTSGNVRGLVCRSCNLMLGNAQDNPAILLSAAEYLRRIRPTD